MCSWEFHVRAKVLLLQSYYSKLILQAKARFLGGNATFCKKTQKYLVKQYFAREAKSNKQKQAFSLNTTFNERIKKVLREKGPEFLGGKIYFERNQKFYKKTQMFICEHNILQENKFCEQKQGFLGKQYFVREHKSSASVCKVSLWSQYFTRKGKRFASECKVSSECNILQENTKVLQANARFNVSKSLWDGIKLWIWDIIVQRN